MRAIHNKLIRGTLTAVLMLIAGTLTGCMSSGGAPALSVMPEDAMPEPALQPDYTMARPAEGSLWTAENRFLLDGHQGGLYWRHGDRGYCGELLFSNGGEFRWETDDQHVGGSADVECIRQSDPSWRDSR